MRIVRQVDLHTIPRSFFDAEYVEICLTTLFFCPFHPPPPLSLLIHLFLSASFTFAFVFTFERHNNRNILMLFFEQHCSLCLCNNFVFLFFSRTRSIIMDSTRMLHRQRMQTQFGLVHKIHRISRMLL